MNFFGTLTFFVFWHLWSSSVDGQVQSLRLWPKDKPIPYEVSNQFNHSESSEIKEALVEIMNLTCIKFVPRTKRELDYIVFMEYMAPSQNIGQCWAGKLADNGFKTIGNQKGRHIVSLWRDLGCFNKFNVIYFMFQILGFIPKTSISYQVGYIHSILAFNYEKDNLKVKENTSFLRLSCDKGRKELQDHPFAMDLKLKGKSPSADSHNPCYQLENQIRLLSQENSNEIKSLYGCNVNKTGDKTNETNSLGTGKLETSECIDESTNCPYWAEAGECTYNPNYMLKRCRASCRQCGDVDFDKLECQDYFKTECPNWAATDQCERDLFVAKYCRISCKQCNRNYTNGKLAQPETDLSTFFNTEPVNPNCAMEAKSGTCESDPVYMDIICDKSVCANYLRKCADKIKNGECAWRAYNGDCEKKPTLCWKIAKVLATWNVAKIPSPIAVNGPQKDNACSSQRIS